MQVTFTETAAEAPSGEVNTFIIHVYFPAGKLSQSFGHKNRSIAKFPFASEPYFVMEEAKRIASCFKESIEVEVGMWFEFKEHPYDIKGN